MFLIDKMTSINSKQNTLYKKFLLNKKHIYFIPITLKRVLLYKITYAINI